MTVGDLRDLLDGVDDDVVVLIPTTMGFDGAFVSPCIDDSGVIDLGIYLEIEDEQEAILLNKDAYEKSFLLAPNGFFEVPAVDPELN